MDRQRLEVADVVRAHRDRFIASRGAVPPADRRVLDDIVRCRTAVLGGHVDKCDSCGHLRVAYNSCRNRHCPKCQGAAQGRWMSARERDVLPVPYYHLVFALPQQLRRIAAQNRSLIYSILFRAASETLTQIAADPDHLGAEIGFICVLHSWGQNLQLHPHVHCLVPGGGLSADGSAWVACRPGFFLPVRVLSRLFRGKFLSLLRTAYDRGRLRFQGDIAGLAEPGAFRNYLAPLSEEEWIVHARPPFGRPRKVLRYLARYTHRVAISNGRLRSMEGDRVSFVWKNYRRNGKLRTMSLDAVEFLRRFLLHRLPRGFVRIRHYGFLANRCRRVKVQRCRELLQAPAPEEPPAQPEADDSAACPACRVGHMVCIIIARVGGEPCRPELAQDTS